LAETNRSEAIEDLRSTMVLKLYGEGFDDGFFQYIASLVLILSNLLISNFYRFYI
jgi:hypothetical protein